MTTTPALTGPRDWELADLQTTPILGGVRLLRLPQVELRDDRLVWGYFLDGTEPQEVDAPRDLLLRFVRLADASSEDICGFASRWGVLGICEHGLPSSHNPPPPFGVHDGPDYSCRPPGDDIGVYWEPIEPWRHLARQARALLNIAARLHEGELGKAADWRVVYERSRGGGPFGKRYRGSLVVERIVLADCVNELLLLGNVRPALSWGPGKSHSSKAEVSLRGWGLFGVLAVQLLMAVSRTAGLATCSYCGESYSPTRRPRAGCLNYCPGCGKKAAWANAQRKRRGLPHLTPRSSR
jgi:hypothetical protein